MGRRNAAGGGSAFRRAAALSGVRDSAHLASALAVAGERGAAERVLRELLASSGRRDLPPFGVAVAYVGLGDADAAFPWLDRAVEERSPWVSGASRASSAMLRKLRLD